MQKNTLSHSIFFRNLCEDWQKALEMLRLRTIRNPFQWAEEERWIAKGASPLSMNGDIRWRGDVFPWAKDMMLSVIDPSVQVNIWWLASGMGKTEFAANVLGWGMSESPRNQMVVYPKEDSVIKFSRDVLERSVINATPCVREKVSVKKSRDSANTLEFKSYEGGSIYIVGAGSSANFRGPRTGTVFGDEIDGWPTTAEGDGIDLLFRRCEGFADAIKILAGTATLKKLPVGDGTFLYRSKTEQWWDQSDQRHWCGPCHSCGEFQILEYERITAVEGQEHRAEYLCKHCEAAWSDKQRYDSAMAGRFIPHAEFTGVRGYRVSGLWSTLPPEKGFATKLHQILKTGRAAKRDPRAWQVFVNTTLNDVYDDADESASMDEYVETLLKSREDYSVPKGVILITCAVDLQIDRLELSWEGWGEMETNIKLEHKVLEGSPQQPEVWKKLIVELQRVWIRDDGAQLKLAMGFIDAGKWGDHVLEFLRDTVAQSPLVGKVRACKGASTPGHPIVDRHYNKLDKNLLGHWVGGDAAKDLIYARLRARETEHGRIRFSMKYSDKFMQQLCSERLEKVMVRGQEIRHYTLPTGRKNEGLDVSVYSLAAFSVRDWDLASMELENLATIPRKDAPPEPQKIQVFQKKNTWI